MECNILWANRKMRVNRDLITDGDDEMKEIGD